MKPNDFAEEIILNYLFAESGLENDNKDEEDESMSNPTPCLCWLILMLARTENKEEIIVNILLPATDLDITYTIKTKLVINS